MSITHHIFNAAIGPCGLAWSTQGLVGVQLPAKDAPTTERLLASRCRSEAGPPPRWITNLVTEIRSYTNGQPVGFLDVIVDQTDIDDFRRALYVQLRGLGFGQTVTYGELAQRLGLSSWEGARTVGDAMGRNPTPIVVPCHRVLAAGGKPGGFSAPGGAATKLKLLALEGVQLSNDRKPAAKRSMSTPRLPGL